MNFRKIQHPPSISPIPTPSFRYFDPLDEDADDDPTIATTERRLMRLTLAACDVGARFAREKMDLDPGSWMLTPRDLFDGERGMDACQDLEPFVRSILANGLSLSLDVSAQDFRGICDLLPQTSDVLHTHEVEQAKDDCAMRVYTCEISGLNDRGRPFQATCAIYDRSEANVREKLASRFGHASALSAKIALEPDRCDRAWALETNELPKIILELASNFPRSLRVEQDLFLVEWKSGSL